MGIMKKLIILITLLSCGKDIPNMENSEHDFKCLYLTSDIGTITRCENIEVICYSKRFNNETLSCIPNNKPIRTFK